ncbi:hypothetical protein QA597_11535 [Marinilabiliaceae bacterium ANBcel2]|nr:hypothetical protein [Marinilabiliaceae bacterium ANBcel2]
MQQAVVLLLISFLLASCLNSNSNSGSASKTGSSYNIDTLNHSHSLKEVEEHLGTTPSDANLWDIPQVNALISNIMDDDKFTEFLLLMQDASPLKKERVIYSMGTLPDEGRQSLGIIMLDTDNNRLHVEMILPNIREVYSTSTSLPKPPREVAARREAFGVIDKESIIRRYPVLYQGNLPCTHHDFITYKLHIDPTNNKYKLFKAKRSGHGEVISEQKGSIYNHRAGEDQIIELLPDNPKTNRSLHFYRQNKSTLYVIDEYANNYSELHYNKDDKLTRQH